MTDQLTPEEIRKAGRAVHDTLCGCDDPLLDTDEDGPKPGRWCTEYTLHDMEEAGRMAVLALTEQQPEPVSWGELNQTLRQGKGYSLDVHFAEIVAEELLSRYTITRKQEADRA